MAPSGLAELKKQSNALVFAGRYAEAIPLLRRILEREPGHADIELNLGIACLATGDFANGWKHYEARLTGSHAATLKANMPYTAPLWSGDDPAGKTLLIHSEQGIGDTLQFARFLPGIRQRCARLFLRTSKRICGLLAYSMPGVDVLPFDRMPTAIDAWAPILSLGRILGLGFEALPGRHPYLYARAELREPWRNRLAAMPAGLKVGVCWAANLNYPEGRQRSLPLQALAPIASVPGVQLLSLQFGPAAEAAESLDAFDIECFGERIGSLEEVAALMCQLDLVISVDTALVHLAGGLGVPCWVLLPEVADWRWLSQRSDTPWYPNLRLFRHPGPSGLPPPVAAAEALLERVRRRG